jgi:hypothetical protein
MEENNRSDQNPEELNAMNQEESTQPAEVENTVETRVVSNEEKPKHMPKNRKKLLLQMKNLLIQLG